MKILTEKDQLREKRDEIDDSLKILSDEIIHTYNRKRRKDNYGILSFIYDDRWLLNYKWKIKLTQRTLLNEYRDVISDRLNKLS